MQKLRTRLMITGKVQGVYYRATTQKQALALQLTGWVRNCPDGSVESVIEGEKDIIEKLLSWCRQGPKGAKVEAIMIEWEPYTGEFTSFSVWPDKV